MGLQEKLQEGKEELFIVSQCVKQGMQQSDLRVQSFPFKNDCG